MNVELFLEDRLTLAWELRGGSLVEKTDLEVGAGLRVEEDDRRTTRYVCGPIDTVLPQAAALGMDCPGGSTRDAFASHRAPEARAAAADYARSVYAALAETGLLEPEVTFTCAVQNVEIAATGLPGPVADTRSTTRLMLRAVAQVGNRQSVHLDVLDPGYPPPLDAPAIASMVRAFHERAMTKVQVAAMPGGIDTFVLAPGETGILFHEIGHLFEGDQPGIAGWLGRKIGSPLVRLVDDPTRPGLPGSMAFDDEGRACSATAMIEDGCLVRLAHCRDTCDERESHTAHARRQSFRHLPLPRLSNTYLSPGSDNAADVLADTQRGVYVAEIAHCRLEPRSRRVQAVVSLGYVIEDGKRGQPCSGPFNFGVRDFLLAIDAVAGDLQFTTGKGICGKQGQFVPVGYGQPTIRLCGLKLA